MQDSKQTAGWFIQVRLQLSVWCLGRAGLSIHTVDVAHVDLPMPSPSSPREAAEPVCALTGNLGDFQGISYTYRGLVVDGDLLPKPRDPRLTAKVFCFMGCFIFHKKNWRRKERYSPDGESSWSH